MKKNLIAYRICSLLKKGDYTLGKTMLDGILISVNNLKIVLFSNHIMVKEVDTSVTHKFKMNRKGLKNIEQLLMLAA